MLCVNCSKPTYQGRVHWTISAIFLLANKHFLLKPGSMTKAGMWPCLAHGAIALACCPAVPKSRALCSGNFGRSFEPCSAYCRVLTRKVQTTRSAHPQVATASLVTPHEPVLQIPAGLI